MTSGIEQHFFEVFGVEPSVYSLWDSKETQIKNFKSYEVYPEITDHKLLKMICTCSSYIQHLDFDDDYTMLYEINAKNIEDLKKEILEDCIDYAKENQEFKQLIKQLFKEGE